MGRKSTAKRQRREERTIGVKPEPCETASPDEEVRERIREVEQELMRLSDGRYVGSNPPDCSLREHLSYLEDVLAFESVDSGISLFQGLEERGLRLPRPEALSESKCVRKAMQIMEALSEIRILLVGWEHMSPRELYATLWHHTLWEGCWVEKKHPYAITLVDVSRSMSREEMMQFLDGLRNQTRVN